MCVVGQGRLSPPVAANNYGNQFVFNGFGAGAGAPVTSHLLKNYGNHNVFNDFGVGAGTPATSHFPKKLWIS